MQAAIEAFTSGSLGLFTPIVDMITGMLDAGTGSWGGGA